MEPEEGCDSVAEASKLKERRWIIKEGGEDDLEDGNETKDEVIVVDRLARASAQNRRGRCIGLASSG